MATITYLPDYERNWINKDRKIREILRKLKFEERFKDYMCDEKFLSVFALKLQCILTVDWSDLERANTAEDFKNFLYKKFEAVKIELDEYISHLKNQIEEV